MRLTGARLVPRAIAALSLALIACGTESGTAGDTSSSALDGASDADGAGDDDATADVHDASDEPQVDAANDVEWPIDESFGIDIPTDTDTPLPPPCGYAPGLDDGIYTALGNGRLSAETTPEALIAATRASIEHARTSNDPIINTLYNLTSDGGSRPDGTSLESISWDPTHDAILMRGAFGRYAEVIRTTHNRDGTPATRDASLALAAETQGGSRRLIMGANPFGQFNVMDAGMEQLMRNALAWLTGQAPTEPFRVVLAHLTDGYWFRDESRTRAWLTANYGDNVSFNDADACDAAALATCLGEGANLLIISQDYDTETEDPLAIRDAVKAAIDAGTPVLYVQLDGTLNPLGRALFSLFGVEDAGDNYWPKLQTIGLDGREQLGRLPASMAAIDAMLSHLASNTFDFPLDPDARSDAEDAAFAAQFDDGANAVRDIMTALDRKGENIFVDCGYPVEKLLALLGDRLRQDIVYPLRVASTPTPTFLRALLADRAVYNARPVNPAQPDLGNFSRATFPNVTPKTVALGLTSRPDFRAAGVYALPGVTVRVTRMDNEAVETGVFVNTQRPASTHVWEDDNFGGYQRPSLLRSATMPLRPGETLEFTSPYGGPIQIAFDGEGKTALFAFENVGRHAYWGGPVDDARFAAEVEANRFDWVEVATDGFEMHSKLDRFRAQTLANPRWNTAPLLAEAVMRYTHSFVRSLGGYRGDGVVEEPEIFGWATARGLPVPRADKMLHMNADQASCGWGCSGNPYDAGWAFDPIGHGDIHELGHSIQRPRWQLSHGGRAYPNHAGTNFYAYYTQARFFDDTGAHPEVQRVPFDAIFDQMQAAHQAGERVGDLSTHMETWFSNTLAGGGDSGIYNSYAFFLQLFMMARRHGTLTNGFHALGRVHAIERAFNAAIADEASWLAGRGAIGFGDTEFSDAKTMNNNDFMAVALSVATELDLRDYLRMWGLRVSAFAEAQIEALGQPVVARSYFALGAEAWVDGALSTQTDSLPLLTIDGTTAWPLR